MATWRIDKSRDGMLWFDILGIVSVTSMQDMRAKTRWNNSKVLVCRHTVSPCLPQTRHVRENAVFSWSRSQSLCRIKIDISEINNKDVYKLGVFTIFFIMPKISIALQQLPPATLSALERLGADLAVARLRRKESLASWASRLGVSVPTLMRLEAGEPGVGMGIYATALWLIGRDAAIAELASPEKDRGALELDVREAITLGKARARASAESRQQRKEVKET